VLTLLLTRWVPLAVGAAGLVLVLPPILGTSGAERQITRLEALSTWVRRLADLLASGATGSLESALTRSADTAPTSIAPEVRLLASRLAPQGIQAALLGFARDVGDPAADQVVMALILQQRHGGRGLARVLASLADDVHDQTRMRREIEADRAKPRSNVRVLVILTLALAIGMIAFAHGFLEPYGTAQGQLALIVVVSLFGIALGWLQHMVRQEIGDRLLVEDDFTGQATRVGGGTT
jgi:tight adherence protein B